MEQNFLKWFEDYKFVAVIRSSSAEDAEEMIKAASAGGFKIFEISIQTPQAMRILESHSKEAECLFGAGMIADGEMAQRAINAGAKFLSNQYTDRDIISVAKHNDCFVIQGASTPTEAITAYRMGADLIKIYHAAFVGGPEYLRSLKANIPFIKLMASGGISMENAFEYLKYCSAVCLRSSVFDKPLVRSDKWGEITDRARQFTQKLEPLKVPK
ncbi:MAG: bifunctional 4-hydroxy-2-oxoglutarate aldolase/2-dehydro-3-deoxy-phosphogluconate aldolase [Candidatus Omnitrophica bacterium]|nr:bifunctional 4-hydroxy-2-oxoglutarate aldolase/2-dehydro-3-deoxy-phosphogluconate aldolase [Candidatus Omnitrophota bacterium]